jgi:hypothetical protein
VLTICLVSTGVVVNLRRPSGGFRLETGLSPSFQVGSSCTSPGSGSEAACDKAKRLYIFVDSEAQWKRQSYLLRRLDEA